MDSINKKFIKKLLSLPEEVEYFFGSELIADLIKEINKTHNLKADFLMELIFEIVNSGFKFYLIEENIVNELGYEEDRAKKIAIDILGKIFLPIDEYLEGIDVKIQILNRGGDYSKYKEYIFKLNQLFEDEKWKAIDELIKKHEELVDPSDEESKIMNIFSSNFLDLLKIEKSESLAYLNGSLVYLLFNKADFKNNIFKFLQNCEERISEKEFILEGEKRYSTVSNWIKDFIKRSGSGMPSNVAISEYVIKSDNAKGITDGEKSSLYRLLLFYRNVKFFPKPLERVEPEKWEIFPVVENISRRGTKKIIGPPKTTAEKNIEVMEEEASHYKDNSLEKLAVKEEIEHEKKIEELRFMATKFAEGSLEKKAIEEELKKMEHKNT